MPQAQTYQSEFTGLEMDARFAAVAQLTAALEALTTVVAQKYVKPASGIPSTDMDADVQAALAKANTAVQSLADYYTKSEVDQLLAAINGMDYVDVATLPTASASTLGKIYLVGPDASGYYAYYYTSYDGSAYSWVGPLGTTQISLANYATKAELSQLDQKRPIFSEGLDLLVLPNDGNGYITSSGTRNTNGNFRTIFIDRNLLSSDIVVDGNADFVHFFDSTKTWISCFKSWNDTGFVRIKSTDIPATCAYVALCWDVRVTQSLSVYDFRRFVETQKETPFAALFRSGSNRFYSTTNTVATSWIMPTYGAQYIIVKIGFSAGAGNKFKVIAAKYISKSNVATVNVAMDASETLYGSSVIIPVANYAGFAFSLNIVNDADETQTFTMASFSAGDVTVERVFQVNVAEGAKKTYTGQPMALDLFSVEMLGSVSSLGWHQSGVFYGKYALFFSERTMLATLVDTDNLTIIGTFPIAYGTYDAPHCNTASLGKDFGGETSIMPLIYVSQWEGDERACFVYDMTYSEGSYSLSLVQKINFASVSSSILGAGPVDFAVDTDAGELIALAYKTVQDVQRGTALMIAKMSIPDASVSEVTVADADITAHFETENIAVRQDAFYRCGKIYIAAGYGNSELAATVTAISVKDGSILSRLETSQFVYGEPEMLDVFGNEIVFSVGGDIIYKILF